MNALTWVIYLSDIVNNVQNIFSFSAFVLGVIIAGILFLLMITEGETNKTSHYKWLIPLLVVTALIAALIPSKQTVLLMAGSEGAEAIVTSPQAKDLFNDIQDVIKSQLNSLKDKKE